MINKRAVSSIHLLEAGCGFIGTPLSHGMEDIVEMQIYVLVLGFYPMDVAGHQGRSRLNLKQCTMGGCERPVSCG
jgi:hypothetical protein